MSPTSSNAPHQQLQELFSHPELWEPLVAVVRRQARLASQQLEANAGEPIAREYRGRKYAFEWVMTLPTLVAEEIAEARAALEQAHEEAAIASAHEAAEVDKL